MKKKITFGFLGLGNLVKLRLSNLFNVELKKFNLEILSVYDKDYNKVKHYSKKFKCPSVKTEKEFFSKNFNFCYVMTPSGSHYQDIKKCFINNKNVIVEKPPTLKVDELKILNKIASKKKLKFYVIYQNRENKAVKFVKKYLQNQKENKIVSVSLNLNWSRNQSYYSGWHGKWKLDGGVLSQQGAHYIDLLCYLFGKPIKAVSMIKNVSNKLQAEDTHIGLVKFKNVPSTISLTTALRPKDYTASIDIVCQKNIIKLHGICCNKVSIYNFENNNDIKLKKICQKNSEEVLNGIGNSHYECFKKILNYSNKKKYKPLKAIDTIDTIKLINMLYKSSFKDKWVYYNENLNSKLGN